MTRSFRRLTEAQLAAMTAARRVPVAAAAVKQSKYRNRKTELEGIRFDSAKEAKRYQSLILLHKAGEITRPALQVTFPLLDGIAYRADFVYAWRPLSGGQARFVVEDCKGVRTKDYLMKRKMMRQLWGIEIHET